MIIANDRPGCYGRILAYNEHGWVTEGVIMTVINNEFCVRTEWDEELLFLDKHTGEETWLVKCWWTGCRHTPSFICKPFAFCFAAPFCFGCLDVV